MDQNYAFEFSRQKSSIIQCAGKLDQNKGKMDLNKGKMDQNVMFEFFRKKLNINGFL